MSSTMRAKTFDATPVSADVRALLDAALSADWRQAFVACGYGWHIDTVSALATALTGGGAGTVLDQDRPEFGISVGAGYTLVPLRVTFAVNPAVLAADNEVTECCLILDRVAAYDGSGTVVTEIPVNMRTNVTANANARCFSAATANITNPTVSAVLAAATRRGNFGDATGMSIEECSLVYEPDVPPFVVGPGALYGYFGGTVAATGYATADFLVIPSDLVSALTR